MLETQCQFCLKWFPCQDVSKHPFKTIFYAGSGHCFCSKDHRDWWCEWASWQKLLGDGIDAYPPDHSPEVEDLNVPKNLYAARMRLKLWLRDSATKEWVSPKGERLSEKKAFQQVKNGV